MYNRLPGDKRRFARLKVTLVVQFEIEVQLQVSPLLYGQQVMAETIDLGCGGIAISTNYDIPADTRLRIKLYLSQSDDPVTSVTPIEAIGQVCANVPLDDGNCRLDISFEEVDLQDSLEIHRFVNTALNN